MEMMLLLLKNNKMVVNLSIQKTINNVMLNIVLFGPPGAGKGTQSAKLVDTFQLVHLSTGDIFRYNIKNETELGKLAKTYIDKGELVPDEVTISMLENEVEKIKEAKGFIFDGFPRTVNQANALDAFLKNRNTEISMMLALNVDEDELVKRLLIRGKDSGRADDSDESIIRNRIKVYNEQTAIAAEYYNQQGKYHGINGIGSIDEIFNRLSAIIVESNR
jgi:adenylate kinase